MAASKNGNEVKLVLVKDGKVVWEFVIPEADFSYSKTRNSTVEGRFKREVSRKNFVLQDAFDKFSNENGQLNVNYNGSLLLAIPLNENTMLEYRVGGSPDISTYEEICFGFYK